MNLLIKLGGTLLDNVANRSEIAWQISPAAAQHRTVVVHGGGKQMTRFLDEHGIASRFVDGLRVSDDAVIDAATKVIAGSVNTQLVASLCAAGRRALGLSGVDGGLTCAERWRDDLGFVGRPVSANGPLLDLLVDSGYLPVVACLAGDAAGTIYNVNADQMAVSCALAFAAARLLFLTDVAGVKDADGSLLPRLSLREIKELVRSGVAHGGMQAKLEAAAVAIQGGVKEVVIAAGQDPSVVSRVLAGEPVGTRVTV